MGWRVRETRSGGKAEEYLHDYIHRESIRVYFAKGRAGVSRDSLMVVQGKGGFSGPRWKQMDDDNLQYVRRSGKQTLHVHAPVGSSILGGWIGRAARKGYDYLPMRGSRWQTTIELRRPGTGGLNNGRARQSCESAPRIGQFRMTTTRRRTDRPITAGVTPHPEFCSLF